MQYFSLQLSVIGAEINVVVFCRAERLIGLSEMTVHLRLKRMTIEVQVLTDQSFTESLVKGTKRTPMSELVLIFPFLFSKSRSSWALA